MRTVEKWARDATITELRSGIKAHQQALKRVSNKSAKIAMYSELRVMKKILAERSR